MLSGAVAVVSSANRSLLSCAEVTHSTSCFDLHFDVYFHTKQQQWCKTTVSAQCWDWLGSLKVLEFWEVVYPSTNDEDVTSGVSSRMVLAEAPQCPSAERGGEAGAAAELAQAAVGSEQPWRVRPRLWSSFTILLEPPQTRAGTALGQLYQWCEGQHEHALGFPLRRGA